MGWTAETSTLLSDPKLPAEVQTPAWWLDAFDIQRGDGPDHPKWQAVHDAVSREWGAFENLEKVTALLGTMTDAKPAPVEIVADAYCAIADRLKAELSGRLDSSGQ
jgi:hypothetical protein